MSQIVDVLFKKVVPCVLPYFHVKAPKLFEHLIYVDFVSIFFVSKTDCNLFFLSSLSLYDHRYMIITSQWESDPPHKLLRILQGTISTLDGMAHTTSLVVCEISFVVYKSPTKWDL